jgi:hypothetical protein
VGNLIFWSYIMKFPVYAGCLEVKIEVVMGCAREARVYYRILWENLSTSD